MKENEILDQGISKDLELKALKKRLIKYTIGLIVLVLLMNTGQNILLAGDPDLYLKLAVNFFAIILIGAFIGLIIGLFRYKELKYKWRWLRGTILTILVLQIIQSCALLRLYGFPFY